MNNGGESMASRILVIEDDPDIGNLLKLNLKDHSFDVDLTQGGKAGLDQSLKNIHDLIILDLMLPDVHGFDICRRVREAGIQTPILMLTAKSSELDRVLGLELGADDYLTKPFSIKELIARVRAILRRVRPISEANPDDHSLPLAHNGLVISIDSRTVTLDGTAVELTALEFDLLVYFARRPGRVFTRAQLLDCVWGYGHDGYEHTVNSHINRLRKKIEPGEEGPRYILTVWGVGYKFAVRESR
jgi:DNA-binding response OmpR family regulator